MIHWIWTAFSTYFLHPGKGNGYQWWSGPGADFSELTLVGVLIVWIRHHNCCHKKCFRLGHPHPDYNGLPVCRRHSYAKLTR